MSHKSAPYNTNEVKRSYFINLYSANAEIRKSASGRNSEFKWNIRNLELGSIAELALVQICSNHANNNTTYCIRSNDCYADGYDGYNTTSAILYLNNGLTNPEVPTYHKLISSNLNSITLIFTDDITSSTAIYGGINNNISFALVLEIIDYVDSLQNF